MKDYMLGVKVEGKLDDYEIQNADIMEQFFLLVCKVHIHDLQHLLPVNGL